ncbi:TPA: hypothetical protein ACGXMH_002927 [Bacillus mobilis]|uniref:hypothetical protein n=1 Tax=Bacillus mobilis TaxID=2026190 RepID=UPI00119CFC57|nr:hypothetical protein [Bacillus mobilis]MED4384482.1 hypothetical protein [Bacillus mobilis]HDX9641095.1 hypothetical protein [Bacillus mobilis]
MKEQEELQVESIQYVYDKEFEEQWERCWHKYNKLKLRAPKFVNTSFYFKGILRCMCSICNGAYFRTKDQRSKGRGDRWYISQCKRKVRDTKVDEEFDKY